MKKIKVFNNIEALSICNFINQLTPEKNDKLGLKVRWAIKKGNDKLAPIAKRYEEFRNEIVNELQSAWFTDEKSEEFIQPKLDADGNPIVDADGNEITESMRKIKEEYIDDYQAAVAEANKKLEEIAMEKNEVELDTFDIDAFVENLDDDGVLTFDDLTMLTAFDEVTNVKEAE